MFWLNCSKQRVIRVGVRHLEGAGAPPWPFPQLCMLLSSGKYCPMDRVALDGRSCTQIPIGGTYSHVLTPRGPRCDEIH